MSYNLVDPVTGDLTRVASSIDTSIIPSNASASNKLVTHQVPYELFTLNNNSGSQKWYKLGKYEEGNYTARLDFVSARVDGQMFESSVRISGIGNDNNYVSWIGEKGCEISTITVKADSARNLYIKMNSYSAVEIRVYGTFTLDIVEQSSEPSGVQIVLNTLATMDKVAQCVESKNPDAKTVSFELNSASWNCGTIYGNTNNGGNFKYDYYITSEDHVELVKQDGYGPQGSITASLSGTTLTLTADGNTTIKTVTIIKS